MPLHISISTILDSSQQPTEIEREERGEDYGVVGGGGEPPKGGKCGGVVGEVIGRWGGWVL